jgi:hypothetical protein
MENWDNRMATTWRQINTRTQPIWDSKSQPQKKKIVYDLNSLIARIHTFLLNVLQCKLVGNSVFGASVHLILSLYAYLQYSNKVNMPLP